MVNRLRTKYLLDNNIVNYLADDNSYNCLLRKLKDCTYYISASVVDEFNNIPNSHIDKRYLCFFRLLKLSPIPVEDSVAVFDASRFGTCKLGDGKVYNEILSFLNSKKNKKNNSRDAILADTAVSNQLTLLTNDNNLILAMKLYGYSVEDWKNL